MHSSRGAPSTSTSAPTDTIVQRRGSLVVVSVCVAVDWWEDSKAIASASHVGDAMGHEQHTVDGVAAAALRAAPVLADLHFAVQCAVIGSTREVRGRQQNSGCVNRQQPWSRAKAHSCESTGKPVHPMMRSVSSEKTLTGFFGVPMYGTCRLVSLAQLVKRSAGCCPATLP